jgi:hypothetical protein
LVLKRVAKSPSNALAGASALLDGALVLATQPVRSKAVPLTVAEQAEPGTAVVVVVEVVLVAAAGEIAGARKLATIARVAIKPAAMAGQQRKPCCLGVISSPMSVSSCVA